MKIIPVLKCKDMNESLLFYINILGFEHKYTDTAPIFPVINLIKDDIEIQLSILGGDGVFGTAINVQTDDVDKLFKTFVQRGLDTSNKNESPVHQTPLNQTWGTREFYVTDPNGNTLRFGTPIK